MAQGSTSSSRKGRGLAKQTKDWGKVPLQIEFNENWQPCGGNYTKLATKIGFAIKDGSSFPLTSEWTEIDDEVKERLWEDIQDNTNVPPQAKNYYFESMAHKWRCWKSRVKKIGFENYTSDEERLANRPKGVVEEQWVELIDIWNSEESKKISMVNKTNRSKQEYMHTTGKLPIPVLKKQRVDKGLPVDRVSIFLASRAKTKNRTTGRMIEKINDAIEELSEEARDNEDAREKIFIDSFGKDGRGRMRCMGMGITTTTMKGRKSGISEAEIVATVRAEFEARMDLQKKELEAQLAAEREANKLQLVAEREANRLQMEKFKEEVLSQFRTQL